MKNEGHGSEVQRMKKHTWSETFLKMEVSINKINKHLLSTHYEEAPCQAPEIQKSQKAVPAIKKLTI